MTPLVAVSCIACLSWTQGLNAASADHIWKFLHLNGFNYHQLAFTQALGRQWAARVIGHATI